MSARLTDVLSLIRASPGRHIRARIFFVHVPKCGGEAVHAAIRNAYGPLAVIRGAQLVRINPGASQRAATVLGEPVGAYREKLLAYHLENPSTRYLAGHVTVSDRLMSIAEPSWSLVTVLREPLSKWFSAYFYDRYKEHEHRKIDVSLEEFAESERGRKLGSEYVWRFAPQFRGEESRSDQAIAQATARLQQFRAVGSLERLDLFEADFRQAFGVPLRIGRTNTSPAARSLRESAITPAIRARVEELCEPNLRVYETVRRDIGLV